jgi:uncharacterized integral membrane protein
MKYLEGVSMLLVAVILFVMVLAVLAVVTFQNFHNEVVLSLFAWHTASLPVGLLLMFAFCLGALALYFVSAAWAWQDSRELRRLRLQVEDLERRVTTAPVGGSVAPIEGQTPPAPVIPMPGMVQKPPDISDMPTLH